LTQDQYRKLILDTATISYVAAGRAADANSCLDEYLDATRGVALMRDGVLRKGYLQAMVATVQVMPYVVINVLQPLLTDEVSDFRLWRLLANAYTATGQPSRK